MYQFATGELGLEQFREGLGKLDGCRTVAIRSSGGIQLARQEANLGHEWNRRNRANL
jgi:hypothetical protein